MIWKIIIVLLLLPNPFARAEFETGNKLYQNMTSNSTGEKMYAIGYVAGVFDAWQHISHCPPTNNVTLGQVHDLIKNYLEYNPAIRHRTADVLIKEVLQKTWPCSNSNNNNRRS